MPGSVARRDPGLIATPSAADLAFDWTFDPASMVLLVTLAIVWWRLRSRHRAWPSSRTWAGAGALAVGAIATQSGIATYDDSSLTAHMLQHTLLGMAVPLLAALAAPVTLVLQAADPATRAVTRRVVHARAVAALSRPLVGFTAFTVSIAVVALTPLLDVAARNDAIHFGLHVHLVVVGALFLWPLVGIDPIPRRAGHGARLLLTLATVPFHAFVGVALLSATTPRFDAYPSMADQRIGAGILWGTGELFTVAVAAVVFRQWYRAELRAGTRADRIADRSAGRSTT